MPHQKWHYRQRRGAFKCVRRRVSVRSLCWLLSSQCVTRISFGHPGTSLPVILFAECTGGGDMCPLCLLCLLPWLLPWLATEQPVIRFRAEWNVADGRKVLCLTSTVCLFCTMSHILSQNHIRYLLLLKLKVVYHNLYEWIHACALSPSLRTPNKIVDLKKLFLG